MTDEERAELREHQKAFGRMRARVDFSMKRGEERLRLALKGKPLPVNPMELDDAGWDGVRVEIGAWDEVLSRRGR